MDLLVPGTPHPSSFTEVYLEYTHDTDGQLVVTVFIERRLRSSVPAGRVSRSLAVCSCHISNPCQFRAGRFERCFDARVQRLSCGSRAKSANDDAPAIIPGKSIPAPFRRSHHPLLFYPDIAPLVSPKGEQLSTRPLTCVQKNIKMSEYCEYMWCDPARGHNSVALARSIYEEGGRFDKRDKKLAIKTVRAILRQMPDVDMECCTDEYITRFLLARKYRTEQAAALIAAYQAQVTHRQDIFGNLTARDPALQRALRAAIPGVLPARDRKGRCVLVILASQWDPIAVPALSVQRAIFLVLEILIQDPRNQQSGFVIVVDWSGFSLRQGSALGAAALRNLIAALRGRFPARFKAIHFLSAPLYVQATLALVKPFLDEKTRNKIYLHGNNLSTLHEHLPTDILPAELGGTGPAFSPGLWAEPVIHLAMKEAEVAAAAKNKKEQLADQSTRLQKPINESKTTNGNHLRSDGSTVLTSTDKTFLNNLRKLSLEKAQIDVELNVINKRSDEQRKTTELAMKNYANSAEERSELKRDCNGDERHDFDERTDQFRNDLVFLDAEINSNEFEMIPDRSGSESSKDNLLDNRLEGKALIITGNSETASEKTNLIT